MGEMAKEIIVAIIGGAATIIAAVIGLIGVLLTNKRKKEAAAAVPGSTSVQPTMQPFVWLLTFMFGVLALIVIVFLVVPRINSDLPGVATTTDVPTETETSTVTTTADPREFVADRAYTLRSGNKGHYTGYWLNGQPESENEDGTFIFGADGSKYVGNWKNGLRDGYGVHVWGAGSAYAGVKYDGPWKNDKQEGEGGTMTWPGDPPHKLIGTWENDKMEGKGKEFLEDGSVIEGIWEDGCLVEGTYFGKTGVKIYDGAWANGKRNGYGLEYDVNGNVIHDGQWKDGIFLGEQETPS